MDIDEIQQIATKYKELEALTNDYHVGEALLPFDSDESTVDTLIGKLLPLLAPRTQTREDIRMHLVADYDPNWLPGVHRDDMLVHQLFIYLLDIIQNSPSVKLIGFYIEKFKLHYSKYSMYTLCGVAQGAGTERGKVKYVYRSLQNLECLERQSEYLSDKLYTSGVYVANGAPGRLNSHNPETDRHRYRYIDDPETEYFAYRPQCQEFVGYVLYSSYPNPQFYYRTKEDFKERMIPITVRDAIYLGE